MEMSENYVLESTESPPESKLYCPVARLRNDVVKRVRTDVVKRLHTGIVARPENTFDDMRGVQDGLDDYPLNIYNAWLENYPNVYTNLKEELEPTVEDLMNGYITRYANPEYNWISEFLHGERWPPGKIVFLEANCSLGKNYYIEELAKSGIYNNILILTNRRGNKQQMINRLKLTEGKLFSGVKVMSYQSLEQSEWIRSENLENYDLIVADEAHFFIKDGNFNGRTPASLKKIMNTRRPVKLFMSATLKELQNLLCNKIKEKYRTNFISDKVIAYQMTKSKQWINFVSCIDLTELAMLVNESGDGWLIFVDSIEKGQNLANMLGDDAIFISAELTEGKGEATKEYHNIVETETLTHRVVVCTSVLDNGVNVKDRRVRNICIACDDRIEMIQMLGRKRCIDEKDTFNLYLLHDFKQSYARKLNLKGQEIKLWESVKLKLKHRNGIPPLPFSLNTDEGEGYRNMIYLDEDKCFKFNELGLYNLRMAENDLRKLYYAEDAFLLKVQWLFNGLVAPPIISTSVDVQARKINRILDVVRIYVGNAYPVKSEEFKGFRKLFSRAFWDSFFLDKEENHRVDRILQPWKINVACKKYGIPLEVIPKKKKYKVNKLHFMKLNINHV